MATKTQVEPTKATAASWFASGEAIVLYIAGAKLLLHLLTATRYGYFGDEMYHLACGQHLAFGYVDQPPVIAVIAWFTRHALGTSLFAIHLLPAIAGAALVWLTGAMAREMGGGRFAQALAAMATACGGVYLVLHRLFTMNAFEPLFWMGCAYLVIRIVNTDNQKLWLWFGVLAGIGLENKYSMGVFGLGVVIGLLLTPERKALAQKWIWLGGAIAFLIILPNLLWNVQQHWPFLELMRNIRASGRDVELGPGSYITQQIFIMSPATLPVWLAGLGWLLVARTGKAYRVLGWAFVTVFVFFMVTKGKDYYTSPAYPIVFAAGGIAFERIARRPRLGWMKPAVVVLLIGLTAPLVPILVPVLSVDSLLRYQAKLPIHPKASEKAHMENPLPHYFAWEFGWEEMVAAVARTYDSLPPDERPRTAILANNFAEAGAIDLLGPKYRLPRAIGGHQSYWLWGPRDYTGERIIFVGFRRERVENRCEHLSVAAELNNAYAQPWEKRPVLLCEGFKANLQQVWPRFKAWD